MATRQDRVNQAIALGLPLPPPDPDDNDDRELSLRERLIRRKRPDEPMGLVERFLRAGIRTVPRTLGGAAQLGGTALEAAGEAVGGERDLLGQAGGGLRRGGEWLSERVAAERERRGLPETTAEKAADIAGTLTGEAAQLFIPGGAGARVLRGGGAGGKALGGLLGGAAGTVPIGAGLQPEESTLGLISPDMAENVIARSAAEGVAAVITGGILYVGGRAVGRVAAPTVRRALGRPTARPGAAAPEPRLPTAEAAAPETTAAPTPTAEATGARAQPLTPQQLEREVVGTVAEAAEPRVPRTWEETQALASDLGVDAPEQLARARDLGGVELSRIHRNATEIGDEITNVTRQMEEGALDPVSGQRRIDQLEDEYSTLITQFSAEGTEAGRALNFLKSFARNVKDPAYWLVKARRVKGKDLTPEETAKIRGLVARVQEGDSEAADELATAVQDLTQIHWFDKAMTVVRSSALSDITMRLRDTLGDNPAMALLESTKDLPAGLADLFLSGIERVAGRSLGGRVEGFGGVLPRGVGQQLRGLSEGIPELGRELFSPQRVGRLPRHGQYIEAGISTAGRPVGIHPSVDWAIALPYKLAAASDILGRPVAGGRIAYNEARAQAIREGVTGRRARNARIREIMANPSEEIANQISGQSDLAVYMAENEATRKWSNVIASGKGRFLQPIAPFTRSVTNVVERSFDYSPASWLRVGKRANDLFQVARSTPGISNTEQEILRAARRRLTQQTGRATVGTAPFLAGWALGDRINTWYPRYGVGSGEERRRRAQAGEPHAAIQIGDRWVPIERNFGPLGVGMLIGAQLRELSRGDDPDAEDDWTAEDHEAALEDAMREHGRDLLELVSLEGATQLGLALGQGMYELTPASDIEGFIRTLGYGPGQPEAAVRQAERVGGLPTPGVLRLGTRLSDPYQREASNLLERYQEQIPRIPGISEPLGLPHSQQLPARLDPYGEPIPRRRAGFEALNPFATQRSRLADDEFRTELDRIGYAVPPLGSREGETDEAARERNAFLGPYTRQLTEAVLASDEYQSLDPDALVAEVGVTGKAADLLRAEATDEQKALVSRTVTNFRRQVSRIMNEDEYEALDPERLVRETGASGEQADQLRADAKAARQQYLLDRLGITPQNQ